MCKLTTNVTLEKHKKNSEGCLALVGKGFVI